MSDDQTWWPEGYGDDPAFQLRRQVGGSIQGGDYARGSAGYPSQQGVPKGFVAGLATTPDTANLQITGDITIVAMVKINAVDATTSRMIINQRATGSDVSFALYLGTGRHLHLKASINGTAYTSANAAPGALPEWVRDGDTVLLAASLDINNGAGGHTFTTQIYDGAWNTIGTDTITGVFTGFNSAQLLRVGQLVGGTSLFDGTIYWVEMRTGLDPTAGTLLARFDPGLHTSGTTFTSPATGGRVWTLSNVNTITAAVPLVRSPLVHTALRYPTDASDANSAVGGRAILHVRPVGPHKVRVEDIYDENSTVIRRIRHPEGTIEIEWGWPPMLKESWIELALVRSSYGRPSTVNDGMTVVRWPRTLFTNVDAEDDPPPKVLDQHLPPGRFYYYALFFRVDQVNWVKGMVNSCLLPRDFGHHAHLWDRIPPYYQWTDNNLSVDSGPLRRFLSVFGYELDHTREFVEQWQNTYDIDRSPARLLNRVGQNFGVPFEASIGEIRYRSLLTRIGDLYERRGTNPCLIQMLTQLTKYKCTSVAGNSLMLQPDDSDFYVGIGNWAGLHEDTADPTGTGAVLTPEKVHLDHNSLIEHTPPTGFGRGSMRVYTPKANETANFAITCGDGVSHTPIPGVPVVGPPQDREIIPLQSGIPVRFGNSYGFSVCVEVDHLPVTVTPGLLWFSGEGQPESLIEAELGPPEGIITAGWHQFVIEASAPTIETVYVVPYLHFRDRTASGGATYSPFIHVAGAMVYKLPVDLGGVTVAPDRFLTVGDLGEEIGSALTFKGTLSGAGTALPSVHAVNDAWTVGTPVPTAIPVYAGVTPSRAAAAGDAIYWTGTAWKNIGPTTDTFKPFVLGSGSAT